MLRSRRIGRHGGAFRRGLISESLLRRAGRPLSLLHARSVEALEAVLFLFILLQHVPITGRKRIHNRPPPSRSQSKPYDAMRADDELGLRVPLMIGYVKASLQPDPLLALGQEPIEARGAFALLHQVLVARDDAVQVVHVVIIVAGGP